MKIKKKKKKQSQLIKNINPDSQLNQSLHKEIRGSILDTPQNGHPEFLNCVDYECKTSIFKLDHLSKEEFTSLKVFYRNTKAFFIGRKIN